MNIQRLRYLVATADVGTLTGAATSRRTLQLALKRALRALEVELGVALLVCAGAMPRLEEAEAATTLSPVT